MRIVLYIHSLAGGGAERVATNLANHWARAGHAVFVLTVAPAGEDAYALDHRVQRVSLGLAQESHGPLHAVVFNARRLWSLGRELRRLRADVVLGLMATANVQLGLIRPWLSAVVVGAEHTHPPQLPMPRAWEALRRRAYSRLGALVALTESTANWIRQNTGARDIRVIPNPVPWPLPSQPPMVPVPAQWQAQRRVLLAVGRLAAEKQLDHAVRCFATLATRHPEWDLVLLGEGAERVRLQRAAQALGIQDRVFFPGRAGNVGDWYACADLYVMTSAYEGFPNSLAEALASGVPAVAYDCLTGPSDLIRHEVSGLLVPPNDERMLTEALRRLMDCTPLRQRMSQEAMQVRDRLAMPRIAGHWMQLFEQLMRPRAR